MLSNRLEGFEEAEGFEDRATDSEVIRVIYNREF